MSPKFSKITHLEVYDYKFIDFIAHVYRGTDDGGV